MAAPDRDLLTIAREVLALAHEDETVTVCTIPDNKVAALARAVIDLTGRLDAERFAHANAAAKVKNVEALADRLDDAEADPMVSRGGVFISRLSAANLIRAALNGGTRD